MKTADAPMDIRVTPDNKYVEVKVNLQKIEKGQRKIEAKVVGGGRHLRVSVISENMKTMHTVGLPRKVTGEGMTMEGNKENQSVVLRLVVVGNGDGDGGSDEVVKSMGGFGKEGLGAFGLLGEMLGLGREEVDDGRRVGGGDGFGVENAEECAHKFGGDSLKIKRCECEVAGNDDEKSLCYAELLASGIKMTKRLGLMDVASEMKHEALACSDGADERKSICLQGIVSKLMTAISEQKGLRKRIRAAIEGDDEATGQNLQALHQHGGIGFPAIGILVLLVSLVGLGLWLTLKELRSSSRYPHANGLTSRLSSAVAMVSNLGSGKSNYSNRARFGNGTNKRDVKMMKD